ncbi:MAG: hypothetical protein CM15mV13_3180 [uncultured marine virus]|nr:MAG: hypothetical protein CM15mV13_3180 [uncultured marine virus]
MARDMAILAIQNKLGFNPYESAYESGGALGGGGGGIESRPDYDYNAGGGFATSTEAGNKYYDASNEIKNNLRFIATTAVGRGLAQYSSLTFGGYGYQSCVDDVVDVLEAVVFNLAHGGNNIVWYASDFYITISNAVQHINSQAAQVKYIFEQARDIAIQVMRQELVTVNGYTEGYAVYDNTITIDNNGATTGQLTPTDATYTPTNGNLVLTKAGHNLQVGDSITLDPNSLVFNCTFDGNQSNKSYPRPWDPALVQLYQLLQEQMIHSL